MTTLLPVTSSPTILYPSSDGTPLAETSLHVDVIVTTLITLRHHLKNRSALVLSNQFLYYAQNYPQMRVAPDAMVIFGVAPGPRDNYKIWEEGQSPSVIFEFTSAGTQDEDQSYKRILYEQIGIEEYWLFDPKGDWIQEQLRGYRLRSDAYEPITDSESRVLGLRLEVKGSVIGFYRLDTGEKLADPDELKQRADQEQQRAEREQQRANQEQQRAESLESLLAIYRERFGELSD